MLVIWLIAIEYDTTPVIINKQQNILSIVVRAVMSPYPTVVIVVIMK